MYRIIFSLLCVGTLSGLANATDAWKPLLEILNRQEPLAPGLVSPFTHVLSADLPALYERELKTIKRSWESTHPSKKPVEKQAQAALREKQNVFFHEAVARLNAETERKLEAATKAPAEMKWNHRATGDIILAQIKHHPVADVQKAVQYDPTGQIGFCFGRALLVHYLLLKAGVRPQDIARIFVLGDLMVREQIWTFHTAILVRDSKDGFIVIDPLLERLTPYREWMKHTAAYEMKGKYSRARFYVTDARKFLPAYGMYDRKQLQDPVLREYFEALAKQMK